MATNRNFLSTFVLLLLASNTLSQTVTEVVTNRDDLTSLANLVEQAGLADDLRTTDGITLFAPNNDALQSFGDEQVFNNDTLSDALLYHVVGVVVPSSQIQNDALVKTLEGRSIRTNVYNTTDGTVITVNGVTVVEADIEADNGVIHIINGVLVPPNGTIIETLRNDDRFTILVSLLRNASLIDLFNDDKPYTVFAPTNEAFNKLPDEYLYNLQKKENKDILIKILGYHVVEGTVFSAGLYDGLRLNTLSNQRINITVDDGQTHINNKDALTEVNLIQEDGVIHVINVVLLPSLTIAELNAIAGYKTLNSLLKEAGLYDTLNNSTAGPFTLFAPSNSAFDELDNKTRSELASNRTELRSVLLYHVLNQTVTTDEFPSDELVETLSGQDVRLNHYDNGASTVNCVLITEPNLGAGKPRGSNGVVHGINKVLVPPTDDIATYLRENPEFSLLVAALEETDLMNTLSGSGPFTLLAPTNEAFENLGNETLSNLLTEDTDTLRGILLYHVLSGTYCSAGIEDNTVVETQEGRNVLFNVNGDHIVVNDRSTVTRADIIATNGVIHVIDEVLQPSEQEPATTTTTTTTTTAVGVGVGTSDSVVLDGSMTLLVITSLVANLFN